MTKKVIQTEQAPKAIGPYSQGVAYTGETIVVSGQLPIVPETGEFAGSDIASQTHQSLKNIRAILESAGVGMNGCGRINNRATSRHQRLREHE